MLTADATTCTITCPQRAWLPRGRVNYGDTPTVTPFAGRPIRHLNSPVPKHSRHVPTVIGIKDIGGDTALTVKMDWWGAAQLL